MTWNNESLRHSNARRYGKAGGIYAQKPFSTKKSKISFSNKSAKTLKADTKNVSSMREKSYDEFSKEAKMGMRKYSSLSSEYMQKMNKLYEKETCKKAGRIDNKEDFYEFVYNKKIKGVILVNRKKLKKGDTIQIIGKRWFDRTYGNSYHSVDVYVNNEFVGREDFAYGYGSQYEQTAKEILEKKDFIRRSERGHYVANMDLRDKYGIKVLSSVSDVSRKKDL